MRAVALYVIAVVLLLFAINGFQWKTFRKSIKLPRKVARMRGRNIEGKITLFVFKTAVLALVALWQTLVFSFRLAWTKTKPKDI